MHVHCFHIVKYFNDSVYTIQSGKMYNNGKYNICYWEKKNAWTEREITLCEL